jgi:sporulation protein YlmC with PRC-barrel domain
MQQLLSLLVIQKTLGCVESSKGKYFRAGAPSLLLDVDLRVQQQHTRGQIPMKALILVSAGALLATTAAFAEGAIMSSVPSSSLTVTDWYKQDVYDQSNSKIGKIDDVLVGQNGQVSALIVGVGGILGAGEKDVAVDFGAVKQTMKDNKVYLTMNTTKDALKSAPGFMYDSDKTAWVPASK